MTQPNEGFQAGLMMDYPLTVAAILRRAAQFFPEKEIVSRLSDGSIHRCTYSRLKAEMEDWSPERQLRVRIKQGIPVANVEMRLLGEQGEDLPRDGNQAGEVAVRGPWVARTYYADSSANAAFIEDGWFRTGDIATMDAFGYMEITDRKKDLIKSRGEWISSVDMENAVMAHPAILEAAVVGRSDSLRGEAPVVYIVLRYPEQTVSAQSVLDVLKSRFATWQLPRLADIHVVASLPKTSVGKLDKRALRRNLAD
jgi:fatty-acyl-CoA synthase